MMVNDHPTPFSYSDDSGFFVQGLDRTQYPLDHCPWCGTTLPKRVGSGPIALANEYARISDMASTIKKPEDCFKFLGIPDYDKPFPDEMGMSTDLRNIEYDNISDWITLELYFQDPNYFRFSIQAKPIPLCNDAEQ